MRREPGASTARCRLASLILASAGLLCVVVLHVVRRDLAPGRHRISEYAIGPHGALMAIAFTCIGGGVVALGAAIATLRGRWSRSTAAALVAAGLGLVASGAWHTDAGRSGALSDAVHSAASAFATCVLVVAALAWSIGRHVGRGRRRSLDAGALLALVAVVLAGTSPVLHRTVWTGTSQRALWATLLAWLIVVAWTLMPPGGGDVSGPSGVTPTLEP